MSLLIGSALLGQGLLSALAQERANRQNMKLAQYKYKTDLDMFERINQYNNPVNQMKRLAEAGLSPHLVYNSGAVTGNTIGSAPSFQPARMEAIDIPDMLGQYQSARLANKQMDLQEVQERNVLADTLNKLASNPGIKADSKLKAQTLDSAVKLMEQSVTQSNLNQQKTIKEIALLEFENKLAESGFTKQDPAYWRAVINELTNMGLTPTEIRRKFDATGLGKLWHEATGGLFKQ